MEFDHRSGVPPAARLGNVKRKLVVPGVEERVPELRLETVFPAERHDDVVAALRGAHPYEEPAFDVYELVS
jgi:hypothetical protein